MKVSLFLANDASVHTDFKAGSLGHIEKIAETNFRLHASGQADQNNRNRQASWYFFRVDDAGIPELILDKYNFKPNKGAITGDTPPVISYDNGHANQPIERETRRTWPPEASPF